jgi:predicted O-linked N-acetylglucosamine transferase (SPINDLY family)
MSAPIHDPLSRGVQALALGQVTQARVCFEEALASSPGDAVALNNLANAFHDAGDHARALELRQRSLRAAVPPLRWRLGSNHLMELQYVSGIDEAALLAAARQWASTLPPPDFTASGAPGGRLRVGFMSGDLCDHPVGFFLKPVLRALDRSRVEPVLFATRFRDDTTAAALREQAEWHDVSRMDDDALVQWLRRHRLDVMVDLSGHTPGNRLPVLARRVAPRQLSWLGYFATTGVPAVDAVVMDPWAVPPGQEGLFTEEVLRMPHSRFCFEPPMEAPEPPPPPVLVRGHVTFGSFNNTSKYNAEVLAAWARILRELPASRLVLKWRTLADPSVRAAIHHAFAVAGIDTGRVELRPASPYGQLLQEYADVDIALDPFPFCGGQTSCEALWMGLPVVTWPQQRAISRQTLSFLGSLAQPQWLRSWVATDVDDYVAKALALARDAHALATIRSDLRAQMRSAPLMDAAGFARAFERLLQAPATQGKA